MPVGILDAQQALTRQVGCRQQRLPTQRGNGGVQQIIEINPPILVNQAGVQQYLVGPGHEIQIVGIHDAQIVQRFASHQHGAGEAGNFQVGPRGEPKGFERFDGDGPHDQVRRRQVRLVKAEAVERLEPAIENVVLVHAGRHQALARQAGRVHEAAEDERRGVDRVAGQTGRIELNTGDQAGTDQGGAIDVSIKEAAQPQIRDGHEMGERVQTVPQGA